MQQPNRTRFRWISAVALTVQLGAGTAFAEDTTPSVFPIDDNDPVASVPSMEQANQQPLEMGYFVMSLSERAEAAEAQGRHSQAAKYYEAMAKAVPDRATGFALACRAHAAAQEWEIALKMCRLALGKEGAKLKDYVLFVQAMLDQPAPWSATDRDDVKAVIARLHQDARSSRDRVEIAELDCKVATHLDDAAALLACNQRLVKLAPNAPATLVYAFAAALKLKDWMQAERVIERARAAKLPAQTVTGMEATLASQRPAVVPRSPLSMPWLLGGGVAALLSAVAAAFAVLRNRQRRAAV